MNGNHDYVNSGYYPYPATEGFMDLFQDPSQGTPHYVHDASVHDQGSAYWSMNMNSYRYGLSGQASTSYYGVYEVSHAIPNMDLSGRGWDYPSSMSIEEEEEEEEEEDDEELTTTTPVTVNVASDENRVNSMNAIPEECSPNHQDAENSEVTWQDNVDPDNMTYEELLDLGEAIGSESRGLSEELISLLPTCKYKSGGIFSRKRSGERCVICQMRYKRGDRQISLPCKHLYHTQCGSKWLTINKTCPVCNAEVFGDESSKQ